MHVVYANEAVPESYAKSIFLCGPTPRSPRVPSWRPKVLQLLEDTGYDGVVFVPESRDGGWKHSYEDQIEWEEACLHLADCILFWIPRDMDTMPGLTTNVEFGVWQDSGKVVVGFPAEAPKNRYIEHYAEKLRIPLAHTMEETIVNALALLGEGALRTGGEREIPLHIWNTVHFQNWYLSQVAVGNILCGAKVVWTFRAGSKRKFVLFWALYVDVYVAAEERHKTNEVVLSRPDISTIVMYHKSRNILDSDIVIIKEFRSPVNNEEGFVYEVPGGSTFKPNQDPFSVAATECKEETGIAIDVSRMKDHGARQLAATVSTHKANVFSVELNKKEIKNIRARDGEMQWVEGNSERTYLQVFKLKEILARPIVDWSVVGMILSVLVVE